MANETTENVPAVTEGDSNAGLSVGEPVYTHWMGCHKIHAECRPVFPAVGPEGEPLCYNVKQDYYEDCEEGFQHLERHAVGQSDDLPEVCLLESD